MNKKIILAVLGLTLMTGVLIGYQMYNKPHQDLADVTPDYELSATELFTIYDADEAEANAKYLDKVIRVKGKILSLNTDDTGQTSITLDAGGLMGGVICQLDTDIRDTDFQKGENVTLNGLCTGMLMDVVLVRCKPV